MLDALIQHFLAAQAHHLGQLEPASFSLILILISLAFLVFLWIVCTLKYIKQRLYYLYRREYSTLRVLLVLRPSYVPRIFRSDNCKKGRSLCSALPASDVLLWQYFLPSFL